MVSERERNALLKFHDAALGQIWPERVRWNTGGDPVDWSGVRIDKKGRVVGLEIVLDDQERKEFQGEMASWRARNFWSKYAVSSIAPELVDLDNLEVLRLSLGLEGAMPVSLGQLGNLETMDLSRNQLSGAIPESLGQLGSLQTLDLHGNRLSGAIPESLGQLGSLRTFDLYDNWLSGTVPESLGHLGNLQTMYLGWNRLSGAIPESLGQLRNLQTMDLCRNRLSGAIPESLGRLGSLQIMDLHSNQLSGTIPESLGQLGRLETMDLCRNLLSGAIPESLGQLGSLQTMDLFVNRLSGALPWSLGQLRSLRTMNMHSNLLSGAIPESLGQLRRLQTMVLYMNHLSGALPESLGQLSSLEIMDLRWNQLSGVLPWSIGQLRSLRTMNMHSNQLSGAIPETIGQLGSLQTMDLHGNRLSGPIPDSLYQLVHLQSLELHNNCLSGLWDYRQGMGSTDAIETTAGRLPCRLAWFIEWLEKRCGHVDKLFPNEFQEPPEAVVKKDFLEIRRYFSAIFEEGTRIERQDIKGVLLGQAGAGKTSLRQSIRNRRPSPTSGPEESTVHIDVEDMDIDGVSLSLYDCAGQVAYYGLLQMFITKRAVCLLVCDAKKFSDSKGASGGERDTGEEDELEEYGRSDDDDDDDDEDDDARRQLYRDVEKLEELGVCEWLRCLSWRVPGCEVLLVATKCDLVPAKTLNSLPRRMEKACQYWLREWKLNPTEINVEEGVSLTSCVTQAVSQHTLSTDSLQTRRAEEWPCDVLSGTHGNSSSSLLRRITHKPGNSGCRGETMIVPRGWDIALTAIDALSAGRNPVSRVRERLGLVDGPGQGKEQKTTRAKGGISMEKLRAKWMRLVDLLKNDNAVDIFNPDSALEGALCIREFEGRLLIQGSQVFLDVTWLTSVLKPVLSQKILKAPGGGIDLGRIGDRTVILRDDQDLILWRKLEIDGILELGLARVLWPGELHERVLEILDSLGLTFKLPNDEHGGLVVLLRMKEVRPESVGVNIATFHRRHSAALTVEWEMPLGVPPGVIERVLAKCSGLGTISTFWRFGLLVQRDLQGDYVGGTFALLLEYSQGRKQLMMEVYGNREAAAPWAALSYAMSAVQSMLAEFPGLPWTGSLRCPYHTDKEIIVFRKARLPGDRLLDRGRGCEGCDPINGGPGAFAVEVARMTKATRPAGSMFQEMQDRMDKLKKEHRVFRPEDTSANDREELKIILETLKETQREELSKMLESNRQLWREVLEFIRSDDGVQEGLGPLLSGMKALLGEKVDVPRLACILPPWKFELTKGLSDREMSPQSWIHRLAEWEADDFKEGKGLFTKRKRLFLVCAHTHRLVPSGDMGQGYEIQSLRTWAKGMTVGVAIMLEALSASLAAMTSTRLPSNLSGELASAGLDKAQEDFVSVVQGHLERLRISDRGIPSEQLRIGSSTQAMKGLEGSAYEALQVFVHTAEDEARLEMVQARRRAKKSSNTSRDSSFVFFEEKMEKVVELHGDSTVQWVLRGQADGWKAARQSNS